MNIISCINIVVLSVLCTLGLVSCSNNDEPTDNKPEVDALESVLGNRVWHSVDVVYIAGNGQVFTSEQIGEVGFYGINMSVKNGKLRIYVPTIGSSMYVYTEHDYQFDSDSGYIYIDDNEDPFAQVLDVEPLRVILATEWGMHIRYGMLDGNPNDDYRVDTASYKQLTLVSADDRLQKECESAMTPQQMQDYFESLK